MKTVTIRIPRKIMQGDTPRAIYSEHAESLLVNLGDIQIRRVSHVEPTDSLSEEALAWLRQNLDGEILPNSWWADLTPVEGPVLGPYDTRDYALTMELTWLKKHGTPFPFNKDDWDNMQEVDVCPCGGRCDPKRLIQKAEPWLNAGQASPL
jgi:hypothetical protein